jgi:hypothetical protein
VRLQQLLLPSGLHCQLLLLLHPWLGCLLLGCWRCHGRCCVRHLLLHLQQALQLLLLLRCWLGPCLQCCC